MRRSYPEDICNYAETLLQTLNGLLSDVLQELQDPNRPTEVGTSSPKWYELPARLQAWLLQEFSDHGIMLYWSAVLVVWSWLKPYFVLVWGARTENVFS